jgi:hypothetical protein
MKLPAGALRDREKIFYGKRACVLVLIMSNSLMDDLRASNCAKAPKLAPELPKWWAR